MYEDQFTGVGGTATIVSVASVVNDGVTAVMTISQGVQAGEGFRIQLEDASLNITGGIDQVTVTVENMSAGNPDLEAVILYETTATSGIFTIDPPMPTSTSGFAGDNILQVGDKDPIEVRYDDIAAQGQPIELIAYSFGVLWGDASKNGTVRALDAAMVLADWVLPFLDPYQLLVGDVDPGPYGGGYVYPDPEPWDASLILQYTVGLITSFPVQNTNNIPNPHPYKQVPDARSLALGAPESSEGSLFVPVVVSELDGVLAGNMTLSFDPAQYEVGEVSVTEGTADYLVASNVIDGRLRIAFAGAQSSSQGPGAILHIPIEPLPNVTPSAHPFEFEETSLNGGNTSVVIAEDPSTVVLPDSYTLWQNWPNPFNPETQIRYSLPEESFVELIVYDLIGQTVRTLVFDHQQPGSYTLTWDGRDNSGYAAAAGIYLYSLQVGDVIKTRKMALIR